MLVRPVPIHCSAYILLFIIRLVTSKYCLTKMLTFLKSQKILKKSIKQGPRLYHYLFFL